MEKSEWTKKTVLFLFQCRFLFFLEAHTLQRGRAAETASSALSFLRTSRLYADEEILIVAEEKKNRCSPEPFRNGLNERFSAKIFE
ncbi:MAG: hypothetical protein IKS80_02170 [Bacteroidaceae bacterium]|nr:hypothetical protein [Bacteroidaceae bacterium]